jgi:hypothetical protein
MSHKRTSSVLEEKAEPCKLACVVPPVEDEDEVKDPLASCEFMEITEGLPEPVAELRKRYNTHLSDHKIIMNELRDLRAERRRSLAEIARLDEVIVRLAAEIRALSE